MSPYTRAVEQAREQAGDLGHALGRTWVRGTTGELTCTVPECTATVRVFFHVPPIIVGSAVQHECVRGAQPKTPPKTLHAPIPAEHALDAVPYLKQAVPV